MINFEDNLQINNRNLDDKINRCERKIIDFGNKSNEIEST